MSNLENVNENYEQGEVINSNDEPAFLNFGNLSYVQINYVEMLRQNRKIVELGGEVTMLTAKLVAVISELASLVGSSVNVDSIMEIPLAILDKTNEIAEFLSQQLRLYSDLHEEVNQKLQQLGDLTNQLFDEDGNIVSFIDGDGNVQVVKYQDILKDSRTREKLEKLNGYDISSVVSMLEMGERIKNYDVFKAIQEKYGVEDGKQYIIDELNKIKENPEISNREKAVQSAARLNEILYGADVKLMYGYGKAHGNYTIDGILNASDCSSYVSTLVKQGNPDFSGGYTGILAQNEMISFEELLPGDIVVSNNHARFYLGRDFEGNYIFAENSSGTKISSYTIDQLKNNYYKAYRVDYGDDNFK